MAWIVQSFSGDNGVELGWEDLVRAMQWGTNWSKIRVGCRCAINNAGTIPGIALVLLQLRIGICTGAQASLSNITTDAIWVGGNTTYTLTFVTGTGGFSYYFLNNGASTQIIYQRITGGVTNNFGSVSANVIYSAAPSVWRSPFFVDFTKASATTITVSSWMPSTGQIVDCTRSNYLAALENESAPTNTTNFAMTGTLVRQTKDWDSVFIGWSRAVPSAVFYDWSVVRFY